MSLTEDAIESAPSTGRASGGLTAVTISTSEGREPLAVTAEATVNEHLVITPAIGADHDTGEWRLSDGHVVTHVPTGLVVSRGPIGGGSIGMLRAMVRAVAGLDWSSPDIADYREGGRLHDNLRRIREAARSEELYKPEPVADDDPAPDLPHTAAGLIQHFVDDAQRALDLMHGKPGDPDDHGISLDVPDPGSEKGTRVNPEWLHAIDRLVDSFGLTYLLAALHRLDPAAADSASDVLAGWWEEGDSTGEWVWQWRDELANGQPLTLPGVPTPSARLDGDLFTETTA